MKITREPIAHNNTQKMHNNVSSHDHHHHRRQESLLIKQDDKFFSRLLSKEKSSSSSTNNKGESSFRFFYYGDSSKGSIPFRWESQPGTPKHPLSAASLPPLTPPPSYQQSAAELKSGSRHSFRIRVSSFFSKFSSKKTSCRSNVSPSLSSSSCSSSFSLPSSSTPTAAFSGRRHRSRSDFQLRFEELFGDNNNNNVNDSSPTSTLCFGAVVTAAQPQVGVAQTVFTFAAGHHHGCA